MGLDDIVDKAKNAADDAADSVKDKAGDVQGCRDRCDAQRAALKP